MPITVEQVDQEIERLQKIRALLSDDAPKTRRKYTAHDANKVKRVMSAEARKRISEAQRARWAKTKKT